MDHRDGRVPRLRVVVGMIHATRRNKYSAQKTPYNGVVYASKAEARRAEYLDMLVRGGAIRWWLGQPRFYLGVAENKYVADFLVMGIDGEWVEDVKGAETPKFKRDKKLWSAFGPCPLHVVKAKGDRWETTEIVKP